MVKRTLVVLGILSLLLTAGTSSAYLGYGFPGGADGGCGPCPPMYLPVDCPPYPVAKTIVKTWQCKIVGPCPAPGPACGPAACGDGMGGMSPGIVTSVANLLGMPFDLLFNHCDSVYGCFNGGFGGLGGKDGPCGPCFGPVPCILAGVPIVLGAPTVMFGALW
jgi:hypothetical protein